MGARSICVFLTAILFLSAAAGNSSGEYWDSINGEDAFKVIKKVPLPKKKWFGSYPQNYTSWVGGCDFAHFRKLTSRLISARKFFEEVANFSIGYYISGKALGKEASEKAKLAVAVIASFLPREVLKHLEWPTDGSLELQVAKMDSDLGISDYYVFGVAAINFNEGKDWIPLGANVKIRVKPTDREPGMFVKEHPTVIRLSHPRFRLQDLKSRVWEKDIRGKLRPTTVDCVFSYEVYRGKKVAEPGGEKLARRWVQAGSPEKGGLVRGTVLLTKLPKLDFAGLREIHLCSPVNKGPMRRLPDDCAFALLLKHSTVRYKCPDTPPLPKTDEELEIKIKIKGFYTDKSKMIGPDEWRFGWEEIADAVFEGAQLEGAGIRKTTVEHKDTYTILRGIPRKSGWVNVVLKTIDDPLRFERVIEVSESDDRYMVWENLWPRVDYKWGNMHGYVGTLQIGTRKEFKSKRKYKDDKYLNFFIRYQCEIQPEYKKQLDKILDTVVSSLPIQDRKKGRLVVPYFETRGDAESWVRNQLKVVKNITWGDIHQIKAAEKKIKDDKEWIADLEKKGGYDETIKAIKKSAEGDKKYLAKLKQRNMTIKLVRAILRDQYVILNF